MAAISAEPFELEAMRMDDGSWHPCHVSLSPSKASCGIIVEFESYAEEEIISNREDALRCLRFRSIPLQDGECFHIKEGECVLAMHKVQSRSLFFDAVIEKPYRVKHSNRVFCRCTFEIKWLSGELDGKSTIVSSNSIMKLSEKNVTSHPVLAAFLNDLSPTNGVEVSPSLSLLEETDSEADLYGLLERQIEEISKLADKSKECTENLLLGAKKGNSQNNCTRSTRSRKKQEAEMEIKKNLEDKPLLSPLAARAALASLMHERPDVSIHSFEKRDHLNLLVKDPKKHIKEQSLDVACIFLKYDASIEDNMLFVSNPSQSTEIDSLVEARYLSRSSASNRSGSMKKSRPNDFTVLSTMQEKAAQASKKSEDKLSSPAIVEHMRNSVTDRKLNGRAITTRRTRSAYQKETLDSTAEEAQPSGELEGILSGPTTIEYTKNSSTDWKLNGRAITTRRTRSAVQKEILDLTDEVAQSSEELEDIQCGTTTIEYSKNSLTDSKLNGRAITARRTRSAVHKEILDSTVEVAQSSEELEDILSGPTTIEYTKNSLTDSKLNGRAITARKTRSVVQKEILDSNAEAVQNEVLVDSNAEVAQGSTNGKHISPTNTRLTRSAKNKATSNPSIMREVGKSRIAEDLSNFSVEDLVTPEKDEAEKKNLFSSPPDAGIVFSLDKKKRTRASSDGTATEEDQGNSGSSPAVKKRDISSKKPELRFSPRLKYLPRTRSQKKS